MLNSGESILYPSFLGERYVVYATDEPAEIVLEKRKVYLRAKWFDVKNLCANLTGLHVSELYVESVNDGNWRGWIVEFSADVDLERLQSSLSQCLILGKRVVFIGIYF